MVAQITSDRTVHFSEDSMLPFPELWLDIYVAGNDIEQRQFAEMFVRSRCRKVTSAFKADIVVFTGGPDVNPALYGEEPHSKTRYDDVRDSDDLKLYHFCLSEGIPMFGVCRGAQFLHVMAGGKLFQDVDNHYGEHKIFDLKANRIVAKVSSVHHQMCMDNTSGGMEIIATAGGVSKIRHINPSVANTGSNNDIEAFFYRDTCALGVQGHPEYRGYFEYMNWCLNLIQSYITFNPDVENRESNIRVKKDLLEQRQTLLVN